MEVNPETTYWNNIAEFGPLWGKLEFTLNCRMSVGVESKLRIYSRYWDPVASLVREFTDIDFGMDPTNNSLQVSLTSNAPITAL